MENSDQLRQEYLIKTETKQVTWINLVDMFGVYTQRVEKQKCDSIEKEETKYCFCVKLIIAMQKYVTDIVSLFEDYSRNGCS